MTDVSWSRCGGQDCIRLRSPAPGAVVEVRPRAGAAIEHAPAMAGRVAGDGDDVCFLPRFGFQAGTAYIVSVDGAPVGLLIRPRPDQSPTTEVLAVHPTAPAVPRNLLRMYVWFSAPMSEGGAAGHVRLVDDTGQALMGALLPNEQELWDSGHRRLTVLLDPARIKRGLLGHRQTGYPLRSGVSFHLVVDTGMRDAKGVPLRAGVDRRYTVEGDERRHIEPDQWALAVPAAGTCDAFEIAFDRPLDYALLARSLWVTGPDGHRIDGGATIGQAERSWQLSPYHPWSARPHFLVVDPVLEDVAGNSVSRVFDRDLDHPQDDPRDPRPISLPFLPR